MNHKYFDGRLNAVVIFDFEGKAHYPIIQPVEEPQTPAPYPADATADFSVRYQETLAKEFMSRDYLEAVEDDKQLAKMLKSDLEFEGYEAALTGTVQKAKDVFENGKFDLVVLDISLPDGSGYDVCRHIRKIKNPAASCGVSSEYECLLIYIDNFGKNRAIHPHSKLWGILGRCSGHPDR